jgi:O-methyltransferase involved in polyketide biosynthesis
MMDLSHVSRTAILLLICRAVASEKNKAEFDDPMAVLCLGKLLTIASEEERRWILKHKRMYEGIHMRDAIAGVRRGKAFDKIVDRFIVDNPKCTVINLACGFDTRFWRIDHEKCRYLELDLPEVVALKREVLSDHLGYEFIGRSVLDLSWIDEVTSNGNTGFILIAEGLFPWLLPQDAARLLHEIGERFTRSQLVLDMVPERYTKGLWKKLVRLHSRLDMDLDVAWDFGIKNSHDLEVYGKGLKVIGEEKGSAGPIITLTVE